MWWCMSIKTQLTSQKTGVYWETIPSYFLLWWWIVKTQLILLWWPTCMASGALFFIFVTKASMYSWIIRLIFLAWYSIVLYLLVVCPWYMYVYVCRGMIKEEDETIPIKLVILTNVTYILHLWWNSHVCIVRKQHLHCIILLLNFS